MVQVGGDYRQVHTKWGFASALNHAPFSASLLQTPHQKAYLPSWTFLGKSGFIQLMYPEGNKILIWGQLNQFEMISPS